MIDIKSTATSKCLKQGQRVTKILKNRITLPGFALYLWALLAQNKNLQYLSLTADMWADTCWMIHLFPVSFLKVAASL